MILAHVLEMPRLYSGTDAAGRPWTTLCLPKAFGERLREMTPRQRASTMRGLLSDMKKSLHA